MTVNGTGWPSWWRQFRAASQRVEVIPDGWEPCPDCATVGEINGIRCRGCAGKGRTPPPGQRRKRDRLTDTIW